jgi:hypothetical protein
MAEFIKYESLGIDESQLEQRYGALATEIAAAKRRILAEHDLRNARKS